jgi:hypothetical protein
MAHLGGSANTEIEAALATVWAAVEDVLDVPSWQGGLDECTALEHDLQGRPTLVETVSDIKVRRVKAVVRFSYAEPARLSWTQEKGDMKSVQGAWELEDLGENRTRARSCWTPNRDGYWDSSSAARWRLRRERNSSTGGQAS